MRIERTATDGDGWGEGHASDPVWAIDLHDPRGTDHPLSRAGNGSARGRSQIASRALNRPRSD
jgi:hypothetical protein